MNGLKQIKSINEAHVAGHQASLVLSRVVGEHGYDLSDSDFDLVFDQLAPVVLGGQVLEGARGLCAAEYARKRDEVATHG